MCIRDSPTACQSRQQHAAEGQLLGNDRLQRDRHESSSRNTARVPGSNAPTATAPTTTPAAAPPYRAPDHQCLRPSPMSSQDRPECRPNTTSTTAPSGTISVCSDPGAKYAATFVT